MKHIRTSCNIILALLLIIMSTSCAGPAGSPAAEETIPAAEETAAPAPDPAAMEKHQAQVFAMDTVMILTVYGENAEEALAAAEREILALEADLDPESVTGSVYALNAGAGTSVVLSEDAFSVMSTAMDYWARSGGALDPGMYPLSKAWGFIGGNYRVPSQEEIGALLAAKDTGGITMDAETLSASVPEGMEVSFGAVAKGYTAQAVCDLWADMGVTSAILSLGGNVQTLGGAKPDGSSWQVAVTDPRDTGSYVGILSVGQAAVVTSGGYQRFFQEGDTTYIHILDPETGCPVTGEGDLLSVTVVTDDGAKADALSTTLYVMGKDAALDFYRDQGDFELVLVTRGNHVIITPGLADVFSGEVESYTYDYLD